MLRQEGTHASFSGGGGRSGDSGAIIFKVSITIQQDRIGWKRRTESAEKSAPFQCFFKPVTLVYHDYL